MFLDPQSIEREAVRRIAHRSSWVSSARGNILAEKRQPHSFCDIHDLSWKTVQGQVAQAVAREIQVKLTPEEQKLLGSSRPVNAKAHDDYLKGLYSYSKDTYEAHDKAVQYFQQAIEEAPNDPLAYAGLADCHEILAWAGDLFAGDLSAKDIMPKARDAARKALQLDEDSAEAHTSLAKAELILDWNWSGAENSNGRLS